MRRYTFVILALALLASTSEAAALRPRLAAVKPGRASVDPRRVDPALIVLKFHEGTGVRLGEGRLAAPDKGASEGDRALLLRRDLTPERVLADLEQANALLQEGGGGRLVRLFSRPEAELDAERADLEEKAGEELADLNLYYQVLLPEADTQAAERLLDALNALSSVEIAYAEPWPAQPAADIAPPTAINVVPNQGYKLASFRGGIDADWSGRLAGGRGAGIRITDLESGWTLDHEDLPGVYFATNGMNFTSHDHGTAVLGVLGAGDNAYGATGIVPDAALGVSSPIWANPFSPHSTAAAVDNAATHLGRGDVLLVEQHYPEPTPPGSTCDPEVCACGQFGYLPAESVPAVYDAIRRATARGIVVVEAAGNGHMNLDDPFYNSRFDRNVRDSGAILVGAGSAMGRSPLCFSNFGSRLDLQSWGGGVATLGYGETPAGDPDPQLRANGSDARQFYTRDFGGTSSASAIVAGAVAAVNGVRRAEGEPLYDSPSMRTWLQVTGAAQAPGSRRIGPAPDLRRALPAVVGEVDGINAAGEAWGWSFHSEFVPNSVQAHFYVDGPYDGGGAWAGSATTGTFRTDINARFGVSGAHGFAFTIPDRFRDDATHTLFAYGIDPSWRQRHRLLDRQISFNLPNVKGTLDGIDGGGRVWGWTYAAQSPAPSLYIHVYVDGPYWSGTFLGQYHASAPRPDVNAVFGITGDHGFDFVLPAWVRDGQPHTIWIYGIDPRGINNRLLGTGSFTL